MELSDILSQESVLFCADVKSKSELIETLAQHAARLTGLPDKTIFQAISERERLGSTGLGNGIAIPHGKLIGMPKVTALFARLAEPIDFDAVDDVPVDLVILLLAPVGSGADHLKALAKVARLLRTEAVVENLRRTSNPQQLHAVLTSAESANYAA
jgi:nitrogen PTS system EIIA component